MKLITLVYVFCLFYVFIPGNLFKLPIKTSKLNHVLIHALLFSAILSVTYPYIENIQLYEPMTASPEEEKKDDDMNDKKMPPVTSSTPPPPPTPTPKGK